MPPLSHELYSYFLVILWTWNIELNSRKSKNKVENILDI